jgi:hypothetical protein
VRAYELGLWETASALAAEIGLPADRVAAIYTEAVQWAAEQVAPNVTRAA